MFVTRGPKDYMVAVLFYIKRKSSLGGPNRKERKMDLSLLLYDF